MITLHDYLPSGNGYKARLLLALLGRAYRLVEIDILQGASRTPEFLAKNPNGRIPVLELEDGRCLAESNAILYYLAQGSAYWPADVFAQAEVLQWMFFEQYSHEPNVATARYWLCIRGTPLSALEQDLLERKQRDGHAALAVMERRLARADWLAGKRCTIADLALYAYTHVADEGGFDLGGYSGIRRWMQRIAALPEYLSIDARPAEADAVGGGGRES